MNEHRLITVPTPTLRPRDMAAALTLTPVSPETLERAWTGLFPLLLDMAGERTNLIAPSTIADDLWTRHIADSLQLLDDCARQARIWVDLRQSGAGFPGRHARLFASPDNPRYHRSSY